MSGRPPARAALSLSADEGSSSGFETFSVIDWKSGLIAELNRSAVRKRLSIGLAGVACINLVTFTMCQVIYVPDGRADFRHPLLWVVELLAVLAFLRKTLGSGWIRSSAAINLVAKLWTTFLILSFNLVTLNCAHGLRTGMVQAGLGDPEHVPFRVIGLGLLSLVFCTRSADVGDRAVDGEHPGLGVPDLWRLMVAVRHGRSHPPAAKGTSRALTGRDRIQAGAAAGFGGGNSLISRRGLINPPLVGLFIVPVASTGTTGERSGQGSSVGIAIIGLLGQAAA